MQQITDILCNPEKVKFITLSKKYCRGQRKQAEGSVDKKQQHSNILYIIKLIFLVILTWLSPDKSHRPWLTARLNESCGHVNVNTEENDMTFYRNQTYNKLPT